MDLLNFKRNVFSQNGEDGIIEKIFEEIGIQDKTCCEFGAWDGVHLCNVRNLIINRGWYGVLIEGNPSKFSQIKQNYDPDQYCAINSFVDDGSNSLDRLLDKCEKIKNKDIDFLSVDIDGLDHLILEALTIKPRVICIEASAGHAPDSYNEIPEKIAKENVGQSLGYFTKIAKKKGYSLVCYTGNAFFVRSEIVSNSKLTEISPEEAYKDFLKHLPKEGKEWLYLVNVGQVPPFYSHNNHYLDYKELGFSDLELKELKKKGYSPINKYLFKIKSRIKKIF